MKKSLLIIMILAGGQYATAQEITVADTSRMRRLAINKIRSFAELLTNISNVDNDEANREYAITNSYTPTPGQFFLNDQVIIHDDIDPRHFSYNNKEDRKIAAYLKDFSQFYPKAGGDTARVRFSNIKVSNVKKTEESTIYLKVFYDSELLLRPSAKYANLGLSYQKISRVAEVNFERTGKDWKALIAKIGFVRPEDLDSTNLNKNDVVIKQITRIESEDDRQAELEKQKIDQQIREYRELVKKGDALFTEGKYEEAIKVYTQALPKALTDKRAEQGISNARRFLNETKENNASIARNKLAEMENYYKRRKYNEALEAGQAGLSAEPENVRILQLISEITDKKGVRDKLTERFSLCRNTDDYKALLDEYKKTSKRDEANPDWHLGMGRCHYILNDLKNAEISFKKALDLDPTFEDALLARSQLYEFKNDIAAAIADLEKYVNFKPRDAEKQMKLGILRTQIGNTKKAIDNFNKAVDLDPDNATYIYERGIYFEKIADYEGAKEDFADVIRKNKALLTEAYFHRGFCLAKLKKYKEAGQDFEKAKSRGDAGLESKVLSQDKKIEYDAYLSKIDSISNALYTNGRTLANQAIELLKKPKKLDDEVKQTNKLTADAIAAYNNAILIKPNNTEAWFRKARIYDAKQSFREAIEDGYDKALEYAPRNSTYLYYRGIARYFLKKYDLALADFTLAFNVDDQFFFALSYKGITQMAQKNYADARSSFLKIKEVESKLVKTEDYARQISTFFPELYYNLGRCEYEIRDKGSDHLDAAVNAFKRSIEYNTYDYPQAYHYLGKTYAALGKPDKALTEYNNAFAVVKESNSGGFDKTMALEDKAEAQSNLKQYAEATKTLSQILDDDDENVPARIIEKRGLNYFNAEQHDPALKDFETLINSNPTEIHTEVYYLAGQAAIYTSQAEKAASYLQKFIEKEKNPTALAKANFAMACSLLQRKADADAYTYFDKAFQTPDLKNAFKKEKLDKLLQVARAGFADNKDFKKKYLK